MKLGFIGTGKITSSVVTGICRSKVSFKKILLSPRNRNTARKLKKKAYISVKKNNADNEALMIAGCILVTNKKRATGIPPSVVRPLIVPEINPVKNFPKLLLIFLFEYPFINKSEKNIISMHINK